MALYPKGKNDNRFKNESRRPKRTESSVTQLIEHTVVDAPGHHKSILGHFNNSGFSTTGYVDKFGVFNQYLDTNRKPGGTRDADKRAITVEHEDDGKPESMPFTDSQVGTMVDFAIWACNTHSIVPRLIQPITKYRVTDARRWRASGIGYHSLPGFDDPINKTGVIRASIWTKFPGKTCPGKLRTIQLVEEIIPLIAKGVAAGAGVDVVTAFELEYGVHVLGLGDNGEGVAKLQSILNELFDTNLTVDGDFGPATLEAVLLAQKAVQVETDGLVGPDTAGAFWRWRTELAKAKLVTPDATPTMQALAKRVKTLEGFH